MNEIEKALNYFKSRKAMMLSDQVQIYEDLAISALEKQLNNGWIPIDERLPDMDECQENDCRFIVTDGNRRYQSNFDYINAVFWEPFQHNTMNFIIDKCVVAWQPIPPKYEVEG